MERDYIRACTLAVIRNKEGKILVDCSYDSVKKEKFYRMLGGGIDMGETGEACIKREMMEELGAEVDVGERLCVIENIFTYEGNLGHQIMLVYPCAFKDKSFYDKEELTMIEFEDRVAVWRTPEEIKAEGAVLHPWQIVEYI